MGELVRTRDWSTSAIGAPDQWPQSLRTTVSNLLNSRFPMFVWWGEALTILYNDACLPLVGEKHPQLLGRSAPDAWPEVWAEIAPLVRQVFRGESTWAGDQLLRINRHGHAEEAYFTFSFSPVFNETGEVGGMLGVCLETTDKMRARKAIEESERNLRDTILQSPAAMCILRGPTFIVDIANDHMFEIWGKEAAQMMHKPVFEGLPEARTQGFEELLTHVYTTGDVFSASEHPVELFRNNQLETVYVNFIYKPFRQSDGTITGVIAVAMDVTELAMTRRKLQESELNLQQRIRERTAELEEYRALLDSILNASINGIMAMDAVRDSAGKIVDFRIIKVNQQAKSLIGVDESMLGQSYLTHFPKSIDYGVFAMYRSVLETGEPARTEFYSTNRNLNAWFDVSVAKRDQEGIVINFSNVSPQREAAIRMEQQKNLLDSILKYSPIGITVYNTIRNGDGKIEDFQTILANDAAEAFTGVSTEERYRKTVLQLTPALKDSPLFQMAVMAIEEGTPFRTEYYREQVGKWLELSVVKMYEEHLINVFRDITPIKEAQLQLEKHIEELKRSNANLEQFAYAASHDMKEPIRKIHIFSDRLKERLSPYLGEEERRYFDRMEHASHRMSTLVEDLLAYSQVTTGVPDVETTELKQTIANVLEDLELEVQETKARITVGPLPVINGNKRQMQQLFQNLISNALKYKKPGVPPEITIASVMIKGKEVKTNLPSGESDRMFHLIKIEDNGVGFQQKDAERIFNVFTRLHSGVEYRGTGVGLSIVQKVVENHRGYVWAESQPGEGATFNILLPAEPLTI